MKENVLDYYIGLDGQMTERTIAQKLAVTIFAGIKFSSTTYGDYCNSNQIR